MENHELVYSSPLLSQKYGEEIIAPHAVAPHMGKHDEVAHGRSRAVC